jgi:hypothetical protein
MYKTIICKLTKEEFYGKLTDLKQHVNRCGELVDSFTFETRIKNSRYDDDGDIVIWENCLSDYWEIVDYDLRKVERALRIDEEENIGVWNTVKKILKWGYCK